MALMGTMLLGGLWHGANWTFVVWGGLHGLYLSAERWLKARFKGFTPGRATLVGLALLTFLLVNITWVFFRAKTFAGAGVVLKGMAGLQVKPEPLIAAGPMIIAVAIVSRDFRNASRHAQHNVGSRDRAHAAGRDRGHLDHAVVRGHHRAGAGQCLHLFRILKPTRRSCAASREGALPAGLRQTAANRPGQAQPVPTRDIPLRPWVKMGTFVFFAVTAADRGVGVECPREYRPSRRRSRRQPAGVGGGAPRRG